MNEALMKEIGNNIKLLRKSKSKMTQKDLSEKLEKSFSAIQKYEYGLCGIPAEVIFKLSNIFSTNIWGIVGISRKDAEIAIRNKEKDDFFSKIETNTSTEFCDYATINDSNSKEYYYQTLIRLEDKKQLDPIEDEFKPLQEMLFDDHISLSIHADGGIINIDNAPYNLNIDELRELSKTVSALNGIKFILDDIPGFIEYKIMKLSNSKNNN